MPEINNRCLFIQGNQNEGYYCPVAPGNRFKRKGEISVCRRGNPNQEICARISAEAANKDSGLGGRTSNFRGKIVISDVDGVGNSTGGSGRS